MVASREGGSNPEMNARLREAVLKAKAANMPNDNIVRAIKKGAGELEGAIYEEITYEGYGPGGAAVIVQTLTDNKNRTAADVRHAFDKNGGNLGTNGCVSFLFNRQGKIYIGAEGLDEDEVMMTALVAGAEDFEASVDGFEITTTQASRRKAPRLRWFRPPRRSSPKKTRRRWKRCWICLTTTTIFRKSGTTGKKNNVKE